MTRPGAESSDYARGGWRRRRCGGAAVLVVDDDRAIRDSLGRALELEGGYDVDLLADGVEALARLRRATFDALVLDV